MLQLKSGYLIIDNASELPCPKTITNLYMDFETQNNFGIPKPGDSDCLARFRKDDGGKYPFGGDRIAGIAMTYDECPNGYYIPLRHTRGINVPLDVARRWMQDVVNLSNNWINHNVNFDATFAYFDNVKVSANTHLIDTYALSRVHDSDRIGYGLKPLREEWLGYPNESVDRVKIFLQQAKTNNWADVPIDILGEYAIDDVLSNRKLFLFLLKHREESVERIWKNEIDLTSVLYDMELDGLRVNTLPCKYESYMALKKIIDSTTDLSAACGEEFRDSVDCIFDLLINRLKLPVLMTIKERDDKGKEIDTGRPSFDKEALALYSVHPDVKASAEACRIVNQIRLYREESQFFSLYSEPFLAYADANNHIHPKYNPIVRTGRMSCSRPNIQQQYERSKRLIIPDEGMGFISKDYSQIEFRLNVHYINDLQAIAAYNDDPNTDFHQWVSDLLHIKRKAGKQMNFAMAYGAGKRRVTQGLMTNPEIVSEISDQVKCLDADVRAKEFERLCHDRAVEVYNLYHERLPGIKATSYKAAEVAKFRGFVFNAYGRRRHLPKQACHKAFNSIIQGTAMDIMKEAMIRLSPRFNSVSRDYGIRLVANVHDEILISCPQDLLTNVELHKHIDNILENPTVSFRVPIKVSTGYSLKNWAEAKS